MQQIELPYGQGLDGGKGYRSLNISQDAVHYSFREPEYAVEESDFRMRLRDLVEPVLTQRGKSTNVAIVVADKTRLCGYTTILPWVVTTLQELDVDPAEITFFIGYGTHPRQSDDECIKAYGEVYNNYRFIHHDCEKKEQFQELGKTGRGTPVRVRKELCSAGLVLTVGALSHHYFAGYGGGRKLIFPGLGEREAIYANHRLFLDPEQSTLSAGCRPGNLVGNPLADDLRDMQSRMPDYHSIHGILDSKGEVARFIFGDSYQDFLAACDELDSYYTVEQKEQYPLVIASAGGFPKDINFIQSHKSIHNAAPLVEDGGTLIMFAECRDGIGSKTFLPYFRMEGWKQAFTELVARYVGNGGTALAMMEKTRRIRIALITDLDEEICREIGVKKISPDQAQLVLDDLDTDCRVGIVANSSLLVTKQKAGIAGGKTVVQP